MKNENTYQQDVIKYFHDKASGYDRVDEQAYWRLSDSILWELFNSRVLSTLPKNFSFLDAGGGTGRWSLKVLEAYPSSNGMVRDLSPDMLQQAKIKQDTVGANRLGLSEGQIETMPEFEDESFDLIFNFHNVIGFLPEPVVAFKEMCRLLKTGGTVVTVAPNYYHMIFFNLSCGRVDEAQKVLESRKGTFVSNMPEINVFSVSDVQKLYSLAGISPTFDCGFPISIYPGYQETQLEGQTATLAQCLEDQKRFEVIRDIEMLLINNTSSESASRGNNLFIVGTKE